MMSAILSSFRRSSSRSARTALSSAASAALLGILVSFLSRLSGVGGDRGTNQPPSEPRSNQSMRETPTYIYVSCIRDPVPVSFHFRPLSGGTGDSRPLTWAFLWARQVLNLRPLTCVKEVERRPATCGSPERSG